MTKDRGEVLNEQRSKKRASLAIVGWFPMGLSGGHNHSRYHYRIRYERGRFRIREGAAVGTGGVGAGEEHKRDRLREGSQYVRVFEGIFYYCIGDRSEDESSGSVRHIRGLCDTVIYNEIFGTKC